jgi:hypothetical protein
MLGSPDAAGGMLMALKRVTPAILLLTIVWAWPAQALPVRFAVNPAGADARIIMLAKFQFCQKKKIDPWDGKCPGWKTIKTEMDLSGDYCVFAQWDRKNRHMGAANFAYGDKAATFVIAPRGFNKSVCS